MNNGLIRKIDDLGRIVIPIEIRNTLNIHNGDTLNIMLDNKNIIINKISTMSNDIYFYDEIKEYLGKILNIDIDISDTEMILTSGLLKGYLLPTNLIKILNDRKIYYSINKENIGLNKQAYYYIIPIIKNSFAIGLIIMNRDSVFSKMELLIGEILAHLLSLK